MKAPRKKVREIREVRTDSKPMSRLKRRLALALEFQAPWDLEATKSEGFPFCSAR